MSRPLHIVRDLDAFVAAAERGAPFGETACGRVRPRRDLTATPHQVSCPGCAQVLMEHGYGAVEEADPDGVFIELGPEMLEPFAHLVPEDFEGGSQAVDEVLMFGTLALGMIPEPTRPVLQRVLDGLALLRESPVAQHAVTLVVDQYKDEVVAWISAFKLRADGELDIEVELEPPASPRLSVVEDPQPSPRSCTVLPRETSHSSSNSRDLGTLLGLLGTKDLPLRDPPEPVVPIVPVAPVVPIVPAPVSADPSEPEAVVRTCRARTARGEPCRNAAIDGQDFCRVTSHQTQVLKAERNAAAAAGAEATP